MHLCCNFTFNSQTSICVPQFNRSIQEACTLYGFAKPWQDKQHLHQRDPHTMILKHFGVIIVLSFVLLIFAHQAQLVLVYLNDAHTILNEKLSYIFSTSTVGNTFQEATCLLLIPFVIAGIPAGIYWLVKRRLIPYFYHVVWGVWIVLFTSIMILR